MPRKALVSHKDAVRGLAYGVSCLAEYEFGGQNPTIEREVCHTNIPIGTDAVCRIAPTPSVTSPRAAASGFFAASSEGIQTLRWIRRPSLLINV